MKHKKLCVNYLSQLVKYKWWLNQSILTFDKYVFASTFELSGEFDVDVVLVVAVVVVVVSAMNKKKYKRN